MSRPPAPPAPALPDESEMEAFTQRLFGGTLHGARMPIAAGVLAALGGAGNDEHAAQTLAAQARAALQALTRTASASPNSASPTPPAAGSAARDAGEGGAAAADASVPPSPASPFLAGLGGVFSAGAADDPALPRGFENLPQIHLQLARATDNPAQATLQAVRFQHGNVRIELQFSQMQVQPTRAPSRFGRALPPRARLPPPV